MATTKPYLIRAIHEWCADEGLTPYLAVQVDAHTQVPREFVRDGQIVLNVSASATHQLQFGNDEISFQTRFNGAAFPVVVPVEAVVAIYARENGQGMAFEASAADADAGKVGSGETATGAVADLPDSSGQPDQPEQPEPPRRGGHLTRIK